MVVGRLLSYREGNFSGAMLNFGEVNALGKTQRVHGTFSAWAPYQTPVGCWVLRTFYSQGQGQIFSGLAAMFVHVRVCPRETFKCWERKSLRSPNLNYFSYLWISVWPNCAQFTCGMYSKNVNTDPASGHRSNRTIQWAIVPAWTHWPRKWSYLDKHKTHNFKINFITFYHIGSIDARPGSLRSLAYQPAKSTMQACQPAKGFIGPKEDTCSSYLRLRGKEHCQEELWPSELGRNILWQTIRKDLCLWLKIPLSSISFSAFQERWCQTTPCNVCGSDDSAKGFSAFSYLFGCYSWTCKQLHGPCRFLNSLHINYKLSFVAVWLWKAFPDIIIQKIISKRSPYVTLSPCGLCNALSNWTK